MTELGAERDITAVELVKSVDTTEVGAEMQTCILFRGRAAKTNHGIV